MVGQNGIDLHLGDTIHFKSKGMIHPEATYEGEVIGCYKYFYEVIGVPLKHTMREKNDGIYGEPKPYKFCIPKYLDSDWDYVHIVEAADIERTA